MALFRVISLLLLAVSAFGQALSPADLPWRAAATQFVAAGGTTPTINSAAKSFSATVPSTASITPTATRALIVAIGGADTTTPGSLPTVSDNIDGTTGWSKAIGRTNVQSGYSMVSYCFYKFNIPAGITTITVNAGAMTFPGIIVHEVSNISAFTTTEVASTSANGSANPQTGAINNATAVSIYFAGSVSDGTGSWTINATGTTGVWNHFSANSHEDDGVNKTAFSVPNIVVSSSASRGHGWTCNSGNEASWIAIFH